MFPVIRHGLLQLKGITITDAFQKILGESDRKLNKIWVDKVEAVNFTTGQ